MKVELMNATEVKWVDRVGTVVAPIGMVGAGTVLMTLLGTSLLFSTIIAAFAVSMFVLVICFHE